MLGGTLLASALGSEEMIYDAGSSFYDRTFKIYWFDENVTFGVSQNFKPIQAHGKYFFNQLYNKG